jgi:hypothetical protein
MGCPKKGLEHHFRPYIEEVLRVSSYMEVVVPDKLVSGQPLFYIISLF